MAERLYLYIHISRYSFFVLLYPCVTSRTPRHYQINILVNLKIVFYQRIVWVLSHCHAETLEHFARINSPPVIVPSDHVSITISPSDETFKFGRDYLVKASSYLAQVRRTFANKDRIMKTQYTPVARPHQIPRQPQMRSPNQKIFKRCRGKSSPSPSHLYMDVDKDVFALFNR